MAKNLDPLEKIRAAKLYLLLKRPFFGSIITRLKLVEDNDSMFKTMAVDGKHLYYNADFINSLSHKQLIFVVCHEVMHCACEHFLRLQGRKRGIWNMATDYFINYILKREGIGEFPEKILHPTLGEIKPLYNEKYKDKSSEEIYDLLIKNGAKEEKGFDVHIYADPNNKGNKDGKDGKGDGKGGAKSLTVDKDGNVSISAKEADQHSEDVRDMIVDAVERFGGNEAGSCPAEIVRMVKELTEPRINWRQLLTSTIQGHFKSDSSFVMPAKKSWSNSAGAIFPGRIPEPAIKVGCAIDVSGSISDEQIQEFVSEVKGIMDTYKGFEIHLWSFDTQCGAYKMFDQDTADELLDWRPEGGGGTHIAESWKFIDEKDLDIDTMIVFTDLCDDSQNHVDPDRIQTVWVINNPWNKDVKPPFGAYAYYE